MSCYGEWILSRNVAHCKILAVGRAAYLKVRDIFVLSNVVILEGGPTSAEAYHCNRTYTGRRTNSTLKRYPRRTAIGIMGLQK